MAAKLLKETESYCAQTKRLQTTLQDTKQIFQDINSANFGVSRSFSASTFYYNDDQNNEDVGEDVELDNNRTNRVPTPDTGQTMQELFQWQQNSCDVSGQPVIAEMSQIEETEIQKVACQPPGFVIFGQATLAKTIIVNELFGREILPLAVSKSARWKSIFFKHGTRNRVEPVIHSEYVVLERDSKRRKPWKVIPVSDLEMGTSEDGSSAVDVFFNHPLLEAGGRVTVACAWDEGVSFDCVYEACMRDVTPVVIYAISENSLNEKDIAQLQFIKSKSPNISIFFIRVSQEQVIYGLTTVDHQGSLSQLESKIIPDVSRNLPHSADNGDASLCDRQASANQLSDQLTNLGFLCTLPTFDDPTQVSDLDTDSDSYSGESELLENFDNFWIISLFAHGVLQRHLVSAVALMNVVHVRCVDMMITTAYSMARDVLCTPARLKFAREKEDELYKSLMEVTVKKQDEIKLLITETITSCCDGLVEKAAEYQFKDVTVPESGEITSIRDLKLCTAQIQELVLVNLNKTIAGRLVGSVDVLRESYTGVLTRCLASLEQQDDNFEPTKTSVALKDILNAAYHVEIPLCASTSFMKTLIEKMKQLMHTMLWRPPPCVNGEWKRKVAINMLATISDARCQRLAKGICTQIRDRLRSSHNRFEMLMKQLEMRTDARLQKTEAQRLKVRKDYAPRVARLSLESRSLKDFILYGKPKMGMEIGRGQYGVVFSCENWGNYGPCAVKSVVPPDAKHWNDLATEFHYTRSVPDHERIVALRGSVIDYTYNSGTGAAVLLIMDRLKWDLYTAIEHKLPWLNRLVVAIDVVEGIRFLHSQGLVHRDVKLKNVLLDENDRGKLTDLGFCKPEAMMSGSIVGTPIHMAPELFSGRYDHSVDVYAFGILFWYVCAGSIRLPCQFNRCASKEMLWQNVKDGIRPEMPYHCDSECWELMQKCWHQHPAKRPLTGEVETVLRGIHRRFETFEKSNLLPEKGNLLPDPRKQLNDTKLMQNDDYSDNTDSDSVG